jgi:CSLREA domain-containing protein
MSQFFFGVLGRSNERFQGRASSKPMSVSGTWTSVKFAVAVLAVLLSGSLVLDKGNAEAASNIIIVNTADDTNTPGDGFCSLREAINNANSIGVDTTGGDCTVGTGTDIVNFGNINFNNGRVDLKSALPNIANNLTIDGAGVTQGAPGIGADGSNGWTIPNAPFLKVNSAATLYVANIFIQAGNSSASNDVYNDGGMVTLSNVVASSNVGGLAIYNGGTMTITNSTITGEQDGGGISNHGTLTMTKSVCCGGPPMDNGGTANVTNSYIGGGINNAGILDVKNVTFLDNIGPLGAVIHNFGSATFSNSILANFNESVGTECAGNPIINGGYNISHDSSCGFGSSTGASGQAIGDDVDPLLEPLSEELQPSSPAIAAIPAARCPAADQRGYPRPAAGQTACDIGAIELQPRSTITVNTVSDSSPPADGLCSLREAINNANSPGTDTTGGDCTTGSTDNDLIVFSVSGQVTLNGELPEIVNMLTIDGRAQRIVIDGADLYQIFSNKTFLNLANLTLSHGGGRYGGAIVNQWSLTVTNCTFTNNSDHGGGGGGAIYNSGILTTVTNSTFSGNSTDGQGSAILGNGGYGGQYAVLISNSTFWGNTNGPNGSGALSGGIFIAASILADNIGGNCDFSLFGDHNISNDATCGFGASTGANGRQLGDSIDPQLDPNGLLGNGGPTKTIALQMTSPAIGAIPAGSANCPGTDQRGEPRPAAGQTGCDIGAFELQGNTPAGTDVAVIASSTTDLTFTNVSTAGTTTATTSFTGPTQPTGFYFGSPATYVDVATTATFSGNIAVCNSYDPAQYTDPAHLSLLHFDGGAWVDVTTSNDTVNHVICGQVTSLSPFVVAQKAVCNTTYSGTVKGNLTITGGSTCIIGGIVIGKVTQTGGRLLASGASIGGNVQILGGDFSIGSGTTVGGNLQVSNLSASKLQYQVCNTKVNGNLQLQSNAAVITVGGANCAGATVGGNIQVQNNTATTAISRSTAKVNILVMNNNGMTSLTGDAAGGNIEVQNNPSITQVMSNSAGGHLNCTGNNPSMVGGPNSASQVQGQCF